jgi:cytochrome c oxidase cbb3-type subunit 3
MTGVILVLLILMKSVAASLLKEARQSRSRERREGKGSGPKAGELIPSQESHGLRVPAALVGGAMLVGMLCLSHGAMAGEPAAGTSAGPVAASISAPVITGLSNTAFYLIMGVAAAQVLVILYLLYNHNLILKDQAAASAKFRLNWRLYGLYCTILFAVIFPWRYHVSHSEPLSAQESSVASHDAGLTGGVDENSVKLLTASSDLAAGKVIFQSTCFACHGKNGEGGVGPNLTDQYWLHGGSIQQVYKTIKYGWPDKGMKSWKDDFSPLQIRQIASYVKSLAGTNPPNAKAPQGDLMK